MNGNETYSYGDPTADHILIQMADDHDLEKIEQEVSHIRRLAPEKRFQLTAVHVNSWTQNLSPWKAPAVFGKEDFGNGAQETLAFLTETVIRPLPAKIYIGGYSLAGLFALWAACQTDIFSGVAAASPSVWFPGFTNYIRKHPLLTDTVYLSLGDREERTRNQYMSRVGDAIRDLYGYLKSQDKNCTLEWNKGNHFKEPDLRTAKAFAWVMENERETGA